MNSELPSADTPLPKHALHGVPHLHEMPKLFVFTVVRNPITRLLSAYLQKVPQEKYRKKYHFYLNDKRRGFSLEDFLQKLQDGLIYKDIHWAPQLSILPYDINKYDYIGKFENLNESLDFIGLKIFGREGRIVTIDHHKTNSMELFDQLSKRELNILRKLYEQDFNEFDYDI